MVGNIDRHRLPYTAKGVEVALIKTGQSTDYYNSLLVFLPAIYPLVLAPNLHYPLPTLQSEVSGCKFGIFTLQYRKVRLPPFMVLLGLSTD